MGSQANKVPRRRPRRLLAHSQPQHKLWHKHRHNVHTNPLPAIELLSEFLQNQTSPARAPAHCMTGSMMISRSTKPHLRHARPVPRCGESTATVPSKQVEPGRSTPRRCSSLSDPLAWLVQRTSFGLNDIGPASNCHEADGGCSVAARLWEYSAAAGRLAVGKKRSSHDGSAVGGRCCNSRALALAAWLRPDVERRRGEVSGRQWSEMTAKCCIRGNDALRHGDDQDRNCRPPFQGSLELEQVN